MRRNMQEVLERWGRWAAREEHCSRVDWPMKSVISECKPDAAKPGCSDEDGLAIDTCVAHMSAVRDPEDILILGLRFIGDQTTRSIAKSMDLPRLQVRASLNASEAFLNGCLVIQGTRLDMDPVVILPDPLAGARKPMVVCQHL